MQLYAVLVQDKPILVISAGDADADGGKAAEIFADNPEMLEAHRKMKAILDAYPDEVKDMTDLSEVEEAIETWLGEDLQVLTHNRQPVWDGDDSTIRVRKAKPDEVARWRMSYMRASAEGEEDAAEQSWVHYLIPVVDPTD